MILLNYIYWAKNVHFGDLKLEKVTESVQCLSMAALEHISVLVLALIWLGEIKLSVLNVKTRCICRIVFEPLKLIPLSYFCPFTVYCQRISF